MPRTSLRDLVGGACVPELAQFRRAVFLDDLEGRGRDAGIVDEADFRRLRRVARQLRVLLVRPAAQIFPAHAEAGVDAFEHLVPFVVVNPLAAALDLPPLAVE